MFEDQSEFLGLLEDGEEGGGDVLDQPGLAELEGVHEGLVSPP